MKLNRKDLRKIGNSFHSNANRLMQADFEDYAKTVRIFVNYIKNTPLLKDYILSCGECNWDLDQLFKDVGKSNGSKIFPVGESEEEEVREIFSILNYIADHDIEIYYGVARGYSSSDKYQDMVKGFNNRVVMILISHIDTFITNIGIDMGLDEKMTFNITTQNGQVNVAIDNATINATNTSGLNNNQLEELISAIKSASNKLSNEEIEIMDTSLQTIQEESHSPKPKKKMINMAIAALKGIKGSAEFAAAIAALIQFLTSATLL